MIEQTLLFGGVDLTHWVYVASVSRKLAPQRNFTQTTVQGRNGVLVGSSRLEPFDVDVQVYFKQRDIFAIERARTQLASILLSSTEQNLVLPYASGYYKAVFTGDVDMSRLWQYPNVTLTFTVTDPVAYGRERKLELTSSNKTAIIDTGGNSDAYFTVSGVPSSSQWYLMRYDVVSGVVQTDTAQTLGTAMSNSPSLIEFDTAQQWCKVDGEYTSIGFYDDYFALRGKQQLKLSQGASATIKWHERWL